MAEKMRALRTFEGNEGLIRRGDVFQVEEKERADELARLQLAEKTDAGAEVTNISQKNAELGDMTKDELKTVAEAEGVTYPDGATKDQIRTAILQKREINYVQDQANQTAGTQSTGTGTGSQTTAPTNNTATDSTTSEPDPSAE